jgi:hypothetical protein
MSLLTICQDAADEVGTIKPATIIGNTEETAVSLKAYASRTGKRLHRRYNWEGLHKRKTITGDATTIGHVLPTDFDRVVFGTTWDQTNDWIFWEALTPKQWNMMIEAFSGDIGIRKRFRIKLNELDAGGDKTEFFVRPKVATTETFQFEYVSTLWVQPTGEAEHDNWLTDWATDTDGSPAIPEELITMGVVWRMKRYLGIRYQDDWAEFENEFDIAKAHDGGAPHLFLGPSKRPMHPSDDPPSSVNV